MQDANTIPTYEEFHEKYYPYVLRWTIGRVNCKEDGFDIVQDTFLKAFQNYHRVTHADGLLSWIFSIARNTLTDFFRSAYTRRVTYLEGIDGCERFIADNDMIENAEIWLDIESILARLEEKDAQVLSAIYVNGYSTREVVVDGLTYDAVKARRWRGRHAFMKMYETQEKQCQNI